MLYMLQVSIWASEGSFYIEPNLDVFVTNYDVTRAERKTAELLGINSSVEKRAQNREKTTSGDYYRVRYLNIQI